jgi:hypothetical protein
MEWSWLCVDFTWNDPNAIALGPTEAWISGAFSLEVKQQGDEAVHSPLN